MQRHFGKVIFEETWIVSLHDSYQVLQKRCKLFPWHGRDLRCTRGDLFSLSTKNLASMVLQAKDLALLTKFQMYAPQNLQSVLAVVESISLVHMVHSRVVEKWPHSIINSSKIRR